MTAPETASELPARDRPGAAHQDAAGGQYLTFSLAGECYGVDILKVQEIKGWTPVTAVPNTPPHIRGVLNLRGAIVPIIDMRARFNLDEIDYTPTTVIIVLTIRSGGANRVLGIVVDAVSDVLNVGAEAIRPTPDFGADVKADFLSGVATVGEQMVMLLDTDRFLNLDALTGLRPADCEP